MEAIGTSETVVLTQEKRCGLAGLYERIVRHEGPFSHYTNPEPMEDGIRVLPSEIKSPVVMDFLMFMYQNDLVAQFDWGHWDEGREFFADRNPDKYDQVNQEFALKLITAVIRNDRFCTGVLCGTFESGDMQNILAKLIELDSGGESV